MSKQKKIITIAILVVILLMAIGYAALTNTELTISGTASATAVQDNFKVYFTGANTVKNPNTNAVEVTVTAQATTATVNISGLSTSGDAAYAILEIENGSNGVDAESVEVTTQATDTTMFDVEATMCDDKGTEISNYAVNSGEKTYVKVSAKLLKTPTKDETANISVVLTATPKAVN